MSRQITVNSIQFKMDPYFPDTATGEVQYDVGVASLSAGNWVFSIINGWGHNTRATVSLAPGAHDPVDVLNSIIALAMSQEELTVGAGDKVFNCRGTVLV